MSKKLNMAVVGAGYIGQVHAACMAQAENINLMAVVDPNEEVGRKVAEQYGVEYISDAAKLADHPEIEAVNICVPEAYHLSTAEICANCGKHILIEKPLAETEADAKKIKEICEKNQVRLLVAHTVHFMNDYVVMKDKYDAGVIGDISQITISRFSIREDMDRFQGRVSILYYIAVHDLEAIQWITGHKIVKISAVQADSLKLYGEEGVSLMYVLDNGATGTMNVGWQLPNGARGMDKITLIGQEGYMEYDQCKSPIDIIRDGGVATPVVVAFTPVQGKITGPYIEANRHFADAVLNEKEFRMDTDDAIYILRVIEAAIRSMESGKMETV